MHVQKIPSVEVEIPQREIVGSTFRDVNIGASRDYIKIVETSCSDGIQLIARLDFIATFDHFPWAYDSLRR